VAVVKKGDGIYTNPESRAHGLLQNMLTPQQQRTWRQLGYIECVGSRGTRYRIRQGAGTRQNVQWLTRFGRIGGTMCAHPTQNNLYLTRARREAYLRDEYWYDTLPPSDLILGQLLTLVTDEAAFVNVAEGKRPTWGLPRRARIHRRLSQAMISFCVAVWLLNLGYAFFSLLYWLATR
jgi:hypothetical protein